MQASLKMNTKLIQIIHPGIDVYDDFITEEDKQHVSNIIGKNYPMVTTLAQVEERKRSYIYFKWYLKLNKNFQTYCV